jgi:hypothetical protein
MIGYILNYLREEIDKLINRPSNTNTNTNTYSNNKFSKYDIDEETYIAFIA